MKTTFSFTFLLCVVLVQAQLRDDFSDGNFTNDPSWIGDQSHFEVNTSHQLHLRSEGTGVSVLATSLQVSGETEWSFWLKLSLNTSANNYARIYLLADSPELDQPLTGIMIQAGGSADSITLMKQTGEILTPLFHFSGYTMAHSTNVMRIKIVYNNNGGWEAWADTTGGEEFIFQGSATALPLPQASWFGFLCRYTSSNATKFYFDDVYAGPVIRDTIPPFVTALTWETSRICRLDLSERADPLQVFNPEYYLTIREGIHPASIQADPILPGCFRLHFSNPFPSPWSDTLWICCLRDMVGNIMSDTLIPFWRFEPQMNDILINEIMSDPEPVSSLPPSEYVELYNRSCFPVDLTGWTLTVGSTIKTFPASSISPQGFLIICKDTLPDLEEQTVTLFTSATTLANDGTRITLRNREDRIIHTVQYSSEWFDDSWKEEGGWSLEMIDPDNPCGCSGNWKPSIDPAGGTPGRQNSVHGLNPDEQPPLAIRSWFPDSVSWEIEFSEPIDTLSLGELSQWVVEPGGKHPLLLDPVEPGYTNIRLVFDDPFEPETIFNLTVMSPIADCAGNFLPVPVGSESAIPCQVERMDVVINEVLSDPVSGSSRFVELFNRTAKVIDLRDLSLASGRGGEGGSLSGAEPISSSALLLFPFDFMAVAANSKALEKSYSVPDTRKIWEMVSFPSLSDDQGEVMLLRSCDEELIDRMTYEESMHYPLLSSREGVSLERISPERASLDPGNWHSASQLAGFATPGYVNSQLLQASEGTGRISVNPSLFTPDNDGHDDVTLISFMLDEAGFQVTVVIFDRSGYRMRNLGSQVLAGTAGEFIWDGTTDDHRKVPIGIYLVYAEFLHPGGKVERIKQPVVVGCAF